MAAERELAIALLVALAVENAAEVVPDAPPGGGAAGLAGGLQLLVCRLGGGGGLALPVGGRHREVQEQAVAVADPLHALVLAALHALGRLPDI